MVIRQAGGLAVVDALGTAPRVRLPFGDVVDFACVGPFLWVVSEGRVHRFALEGAEAVDPPIELPDEHGRLYPTSTGNAHSALWLGYRRLLVQDIDGEVKVEDVTDEAGASAFVGLLGGRRLVVVEDQTIRVRDAGRSNDLARAPLPVVGQAVAASSLFRGQAMTVLVEGKDEDVFLVLRPGGALVHRVPLPRTRFCAIADVSGLALVYEPEDVRLLAIDLRYGRLRARVESPLLPEALGVDADGRYVTIAGFEAAEDEAGAHEGGDDARDPVPAVLHQPYTDVFGGGAREQSADPDQDETRRAIEGGVIRSLTGRDAAQRVDAAQASVSQGGADGEGDMDGAAVPPLPGASSEPPEPVVVPDVPLLGLGQRAAPGEAGAVRRSRDRSYPPYDRPEEHLEELLALTAARAYKSIAHAWHSGRLSLGSEDALPGQREVAALVGRGGAYAPEEVVEAERRLSELAERSGSRATASMASGMVLPFVELGQEFGLEGLESQVLLLAVAPHLRGEIARLYGVLANDESRPVCDRYLIELLLGGEDLAERTRVARALRPDGPLVQFGLVRFPGERGSDNLFTPVTVEPALLRRLRGDRFGGAGPMDITTMYHAERSLDELRVPVALKRDLVLALARPPHSRQPHRVILRGRRGSGRRSLAAALATRAGKLLAVIDCERLPRTGPPFAMALGEEMLRAGIRGAVACVSGLEVFDSTDAEGLEHIRATFRSYPGPVFLRTSPEFQPPLDPGYLSFVLPPLSESERLAFWTEALAAHGLHADSVDRLAARFRIGPGTIESVIRGVEARLDPALSGAGAGASAGAPGLPAGVSAGGPAGGIDGVGEDVGDVLDAAARQHIESRMSNVASHITRLPSWEQVALPDDMLDSIREFVGRVRYRRTVYESWGFEHKMSTSRGLTALFYGPPGTGKTMVAGLIARELGLDLYRVDLARITSKWIGETEKNLAEVFDAAEDGQVIILFDEADALFGKRTSEVKSSVDRYANLEVNYLLQRLDTFEGVAVLTTNLEGAIDKAFKRRMSLRLAFPFPDEDMRVRLWAAHIPAEMPTAGDFDFDDLAKRFPMSGGYIRNSALRAAFLAAQENEPMTHQHLERAIHLEYREMGKLAAGGRME